MGIDKTIIARPRMPLEDQVKQLQGRIIQIRDSTMGAIDKVVRNYYVEYGCFTDELIRSVTSRKRDPTKAAKQEVFESLNHMVADAGRMLADYYLEISNSIVQNSGKVMAFSGKPFRSEHRINVNANGNLIPAGPYNWHFLDKIDPCRDSFDLWSKLQHIYIQQWRFVEFTPRAGPEIKADVLKEKVYVRTPNYSLLRFSQFHYVDALAYIRNKMREAHDHSPSDVIGYSNHMLERSLSLINSVGSAVYGANDFAVKLSESKSRAA